jgi:hypothetical protein
MDIFSGLVHGRFQAGFGNPWLFFRVVPALKVGKKRFFAFICLYLPLFGFIWLYLAPVASSLRGLG